MFPNWSIWSPISLHDVNHHYEVLLHIPNSIIQFFWPRNTCCVRLVRVSHCVTLCVFIYKCLSKCACIGPFTVLLHLIFVWSEFDYLCFALHQNIFKWLIYHIEKKTTYFVDIYILDLMLICYNTKIFFLKISYKSLFYVQNRSISLQNFSYIYINLGENKSISHIFI